MNIVRPVPGSDAVDRLETDNPLGRKKRLWVEKAMVREGHVQLGLEAIAAVAAGSHICMNS